MWFKRKKKDKDTVHLTMPEAWGEMTEDQLLTVFRLIAQNLSAPEIKTICLFKWNRIKILGRTNKEEFWARKGKQMFIMNARIVQSLTTAMDFIDEMPEFPVRVRKICGHKAAPVLFDEVPFERFLYCDNLFQGYLHTKEMDILKEMVQVLYDLEDISKVEDIEAYAVMAFYWFAALKGILAKQFYHFYVPIESVDGDDGLQAKSLHEKLTAAVNSQIRALTGGDVTKEPYVMKIDTIRALTELDAKARETDEMNKKK